LCFYYTYCAPPLSTINTVFFVFVFGHFGIVFLNDFEIWNVVFVFGHFGTVFLNDFEIFVFGHFGIWNVVAFVFGHFGTVFLNDFEIFGIFDVFVPPSDSLIYGFSRQVGFLPNF
jgi:hypothetical protein